jgi:hypothetical protein
MQQNPEASISSDSQGMAHVLRNTKLYYRLVKNSATGSSSESDPLRLYFFKDSPIYG